MAKRRALIVDDSKTAQIRLRKMLERFDLDVDTVLSAEEALGYLSYRQPSVIFLDHHMEGMDGLEALKIIKSNPSTALIPVIMYTSEKGDVYVGQARALGAIDIIGKGTIKHESLEKVLSSLGIADGSAAPKDVKGKPGASVAAKTNAVPKPSRPLPITSYDNPDSLGSPEAQDEDLEKVQRQISRLFELHIAKVRQEIEDSTKFLLRRLTKEDKPKKVNKTGSETPVVPVEPFIIEPEPAKDGLSTVFLGIALMGIAFLGYHLYINNRHQVLLSDQYDELIARTRAQESLIGRLFEKVSDNSSSRSNAKAFAERQVLLDSLSWAVNADTQIAFGEQGLNDQRIYMLGELLALLTASNFTGQVYLDVHMGNYCVVEDMSGGWILPEPESNLEDCRFLSVEQIDTPIEDQVSLGFLNYMHSAPILTEGNIDVEMSSQGYLEPQVSYPPTTSATSAGQWNAVAQKNNRISISFSAN